MDEQQTTPVNPRRRRRTKEEIFKENYLPVIIIGISILLCAVFIIGAVSRSIAQKRAHEEAVAASIAAAEELKRKQDAEAEQLLASAQEYANDYDYQQAIATIDRFSGDITIYPTLLSKRAEYESIEQQLVLWNDPGQVVNLSFQLLIADPNRAFKDRTYASAYNRNFVTIDEFSKILSQLYENGYILVNLDDIYASKTDENGNLTYEPKDLYLPSGKRPLMITQTQVNYYTYMTDGNGDRIPDAKGAGFATKLILEDGKLVNSYITSDGQTITGAFDLVPILENFIASHPDFSYRGAKATLAVTGYDGLFGYRTNPSAEKTFGTSAYQAAVQGAKKIIQALREAGYEIACYTYENLAYGNISVNTIKQDLSYWKNEVTPILGDVRTFVFAQNSDISSSAGPYSGQYYTVLRDAGFDIFLGFCGQNGNSWSYEGGQYARLGRLMVSGSNMAYHSSWFDGLFDCDAILDSTRGTIPK